FAFHQSVVATALHVEADHRLGVRHAQVEAPVGEGHAHTIGVIDVQRLPFVELQHPRDHHLRVVDTAVDLAAGGEALNAFIHQLRERLACLPDQLEYQQPGDHAA